VLLLESCFAAVPVVLGHFRPLILLPIGLLAGLPPAQMEVLVHELAHIRRHDYLMNLLQRFAEAYHPVVWWYSAVMRDEQEKCCDDVVVSFTGQAHEYALALVALEQSRFRGRQTAIAVTGGNLMKRIHRLLYPKRSGAPWSTLLAVAFFFLDRMRIGCRLAIRAIEAKPHSLTITDGQLLNIFLFQMAERGCRLYY
jgi:beta-lactamase regulating signal transducer with metallopeptidase domain